MNTSIHSVKLEEVKACQFGVGVIGRANFAEQHGRNGTLSMFFDSAEDCQVAADALADLAKQMRRQQGEKVA